MLLFRAGLAKLGRARWLWDKYNKCSVEGLRSRRSVSDGATPESQFSFGT